MNPNQQMMHDLLRLAEVAFKNMLGSRVDLASSFSDKAGHFASKLNLVSRDEFDAAIAMIAKARQMQENLDDRLRVIESKLNLAPQKKPVKTTKKRLPSVKHTPSRKKRT